MAPISEQERLIAAELQLLNNQTGYNFPASMGTAHDYGNITLAKAGFVILRFTLSSGVGVNCSCRVKVGSYYVWAKSWTTSFTNVNYSAVVWLAAGTYDVLVEGYQGSGSGSVGPMVVGYIPFNDIQGSALAAYSSGIVLTVANRNTPLGPLLQAVYAVQIYATTSGAITRLENIGDNFTNGVSVLIDGVQVNWSERNYPDVGNGDGVSGKCFLPYSVGASHTVTFSLRNGSTTIHVSVTACPWILSPVNHSPVNLTFSQLSTVDIILNPLFDDPTKFIGVGQARSISFGTATDYYNSTSATGLINYSYMIDTPDISQVDLFVNGFGGCIEAIAVDLR
jgi:hypothetical protein